MKYIYLLAFALLMGACSSDNDLGQDITDVEKYLKDNNIEATYFEPGYYVKIDNPGSEEKPTINSIVKCNYKGYLLDGEVFDENNNIEFPLSSVIRGWQLGMQKFGRGGSGTLYLPPSLGYGANGTGSIPGNAALVFDVDVLDFR